mmetsp:Transcript_39399/g.39926  ORF Transcript_39399/g.39926 Transcript_39399/m.39926 type:complete len:104 (-) Transcript_39399:837-1148(-)
MLPNVAPKISIWFLNLSLCSLLLFSNLLRGVRGIFHAPVNFHAENKYKTKVLPSLTKLVQVSFFPRPKEENTNSLETFNICFIVHSAAVFAFVHPLTYPPQHN